MDIEIGDETFTKNPGILEEIAYRDTWGMGADSFIAMIYERLILMRDLLADDGSIYVHCDQRLSGYMRLALDEVFGKDSFVNEIIWRRTGAHGTTRSFGVIHDTIYFYGKTATYTFTPPTTDLPQEYIDSHYTQVDEKGRRYQLVSAHGAGRGPARSFSGKVMTPPPGRHWAYSQDRIDAMIEQGLIEFSSGQIIKIHKDKNSIVTREVLTQKWFDWIDYWSVDFNFESKREIIRKLVEPSVAHAPGSEPNPEPEASAPGAQWEEVWTGDYIFENEWQSFRTKKNRELEYTSPYHECEPGRRKIAVKVVDIFGNDTMTIVEVTVGEKPVKKTTKTAKP
jgi:hypothetical protein